ncbi:MAG: hypothetical protein ACYS8Z_26600 [Planctomycetota bacterium]
MNRRCNINTASIMFLVALLLLGQAIAYENYHDPKLNDQGYCSSCHPGFTGGFGDTLHSLHTGGSDPMTFNCNLCHSGQGHDNPSTVWSAGDHSDGLGCAGCHGRDYGETTTLGTRGLPGITRPKASGYGLRRHHISSGVAACKSCHTYAEPLPENAQNPPYYPRADVSLGGRQLDTCFNDDTGNDGDSLGLDDDGDLLYGRSDPDCGPCTVEFDDFARFALSWLDSACDPFNHYCDGADLDRLGDTDFGDLAGFAGLWLQDCPNDWLLK